jgi:hypothetical protein
MSTRQPPSPTEVAEMLSWVGSNAYEMADGWVRFVVDGDIAAGRSSDIALRSLVEFLVGRKGGRHRNDFWPTDAHPGWQVPSAEVNHLRDRLDHLDKQSAHLSLDRAKPFQAQPERWGDTVNRVMDLTRRYTDEINGHPAHQRLAGPVAQAEARLKALP